MPGLKKSPYPTGSSEIRTDGDPTGVPELGIDFNVYVKKGPEDIGTEPLVDERGESSSAGASVSNDLVRNIVDFAITDSLGRHKKPYKAETFIRAFDIARDLYVAVVTKTAGYNEKHFRAWSEREDDIRRFGRQ